MLQSTLQNKEKRRLLGLRVSVLVCVSVGQEGH